MKANDHDRNSIRTVKVCDEDISKSLHMIFKSFTENGIYPNEWKKGNAFFIHEKGDRQE